MEAIYQCLLGVGERQAILRRLIRIYLALIGLIRAPRGPVGMRMVKLLPLAVLAALSAPAAVTVTPQEMAQKQQWVQQNLLTPTNLPPFAFNYVGVPSSSLLPNWVRSQSDTVL